MANEEKYLYPVEELDDIIAKMDEGIEFMVSEQVMIEVELRKKELSNQLFGDDDEEETAYQRRKHQEMMRDHIKSQAKKAKRVDVLEITLSDEQKAKIRESMETSIVRPDPNSPYNMSDDALYDSAEKKLIMEKLSKLRVAYYNPQDYQNAINVIMQAVEYSLEHDYPWMSKDDAVKAFNEGRIEFSFCQIPKLFLNFRTQIKDPLILQGVVDGKVELVNRNDRSYDKKSYKDSKLVAAPYSVFSREEEEYYTNAHRRGEFTPLSGIIQARNTIYNRFAPTTVNQQYTKYNGLLDKSNEPITFDWTQDNAHEKYALVRNHKTFDIASIMAFVNSQNKGINNQIAANMQSYISAINSTNLTADDRIVHNTGYKQQNSDIVKTEQSIVEKIMMNNLIKG